MPVEIEAKLKVDSHEQVRATLSATGATCIGRVLEQNHIFDSADRTMLKTDCGLRVRICRDNTGQATSITMTYKGPPSDSQFKTRPEIQFQVDDDGSARDFLGALGFVEALTFEKRRESWQLGDCRVELDELPHLGLYVEIEGPSESAVAIAQEAIGLAHLPHEPRSYIAMLVEHAREHGLATTDFTFSASGRG